MSRNLDENACNKPKLLVIQDTERGGESMCYTFKIQTQTT